MTNSSDWNNIFMERPWSPCYFIILKNLPAISDASYFPLGSSLYLILEKEDDTIDSIWEVYSITDVVNPIIQEIPIKDGRINVQSLENSKINRRRNFQGAVIRVGAVNDTFYAGETKFAVQDEDTNQTQFASGMAVELLKVFEYTFNFSSAAISANWGTFEGSTDPLELDNLLTNREIELAISQLHISPSRKKKWAILHPTYTEKVLVFYSPPAATTIHDIYVSSFQYQVWIAILVTWTLLVTAIHVFLWLKLTWSSTDADLRQMDLDFAKESTIWGIGAICQQGWHIQPSSPSIRILYIFGFMLGMICFIAFASEIVSTLATKFKVIKEFRDLIKHKFRFITEADTIGWEHAESILTSYGLQMGNATNRTKILKLKENALKYIMAHRNLAHLTCLSEFSVSARFNNVTEQVQCKSFEFIPIGRGRISYSMMLPLDSPFAEFFNWRILHMMQVGVLHRNANGFEKSTVTRCGETGKFGQNQLGILDVSTCYVILVCGVLLSAGIIIIEKLISLVTLAKSQLYDFIL